MATIYDAVNVSAIRSSATMLLAYIDGDYVNLTAMSERFPNAQILTVTTKGTNAADICDVESGDATPAVAAQGVRNGLYRTVYSSTSTFTDGLQSALQGLSWNWYAADPTGDPHLVPGSVATQYAWPGHGSPGDYDISMTDGSWPNPPAPTPPPAPQPQELNMNATDPTSGGYWCCFADGHVEAYGGAPYLGGANAGGHTGNWTLVGPVCGFSAYKDSSGQWGYVITALRSTPYNGEYAANYAFPRNASEA